MSRPLSDPSSPYRGTRPGGRSARIRAAVLDAALDLLGEVGYDALTLPQVARRAEVHPTTIYRRWHTKHGLLTDAMLAHFEQQLPPPDTGNLRGDLHQFLTDLIKLLSQRPVRAILSALAADPTMDSDASMQRARYWRERFSHSAVIVERAVAREELPKGVSGDEVIETAVAPIHMRALITGRPFDDAYIARHIDRTIAAFSAQNASPRDDHTRTSEGGRLATPKGDAR